MGIVLTPSIEDYLKAIYEITEEKKVVRVKDLAFKLKVKMSSVANAIKILSQKELIVHEHYGYIELTPKGTEIGRELYERHLILYRFLTKILQVDPSIASKDACSIEHYLHPETVEKMVKLLDFISNAPNSEPQWMIKFKKFIETGVNECRYARTLDKLEISKTATIKSINLKNEAKKRLMDMGIIKGEKVKVIKKAPLGDPIEILIKGYKLSIRKNEAKGIEIEEDQEKDAAINNGVEKQAIEDV